MADDIQRVEDENSSLREQIEQVQQKRREGFAKAEELSRVASVNEENERLKKVLADQTRILEREEKIRGNIGEEADSGVRSPDVPYTNTPNGPIVSDDYEDVEDRDGELDLNEEN